MNKKISPALGLTAIVAITLVIFQSGCTSDAEPSNEPVQEKTELSQSELVARGQYLTTVSGCNDCHSPKVFGPQGMSLDTTRLLSGHPAGDPLPPIDIKALQPGHWLLFGADLTSAVGPWGLTFSANLTPDSATGIGAWREVDFINALRTGKHAGIAAGRPIMPPMPYEAIAKMTDEDLKAIYSFLRILKPISNRVPNPVPPNEVAKMVK